MVSALSVPGDVLVHNSLNNDVCGEHSSGVSSAVAYILAAGSGVATMVVEIQVIDALAMTGASSVIGHSCFWGSSDRFINGRRDMRIMETSPGDVVSQLGLGASALAYYVFTLVAARVDVQYSRESRRLTPFGLFYAGLFADSGAFGYGFALGVGADLIALMVKQSAYY